jgi:hypothetical protein
MIHSTGVTPVRTWAAVVAFGWGDNLVTVGAGYTPPPYRHQCNNGIPCAGKLCLSHQGQ